MRISLPISVSTLPDFYNRTINPGRPLVNNFLATEGVNP